MRAKTWTIGTILIAGILFISVGALAQMSIPASEQGQENSQAPTHSPGVGDDLVLTPPGLEKIVFIHYRKGFGKPPWAGGGPKEKESKCYDFLGRGAKWRSLPVLYLTINPDNPYLLSQEFLGNAIFDGAFEWDSHTASGLFYTYRFNDSADWDGDEGDLPDGKNEFVFADYLEPEVIAVTVIWGYFSGPPGMRQITEFDILFDTDYMWGDADPDADGVVDDETVMDIQNIATHEIGHGLGLADLYETACSAETMYGYSQEGEIKKRDLNDGDKTGIQKLYGAP